MASDPGPGAEVGRDACPNLADTPPPMSPRRAALMEHARRFRADNWPDLTEEQIETLQAIFAAAPDPQVRP